MADIEYTGQMGRAAGVKPAAGGAVTGSIANILGTVVSIGLLVGVGVWGYKLMVRDVSGVPVVRAIEGPMRVQPKDPGGQQADNQGLAVNAVAAHGAAAAPADRLLLAPAPVDLTDEDAPMGEIISTLAETTQVSANTVNSDAVAAFQAGSVEALVDQLTAGLEPLAGFDETARASDDTGLIVQPEPLNTATPAPAILTTAFLETPTPEVIPAVVITGPGPRQSLRPQLRPAAFLRPATGDATDASVAAAIAAATPLDVDPDSLPIGTKLAQLGAYGSADVARAEWDRLNAKFGDYLNGKSRVIQKATSGGRVFYRLRAMGFDDLSDARRFCSALVAENADCIPVTTR